MINICSLCKNKEASNHNSHIIPKFLGKRLFNDTNPRHSLLFGKEKKPIKVQDTPKTKHFLCKRCEKGFSILETYCARYLNRYDNLAYRTNSYFNHEQVGNLRYYVIHELKIKIYNLFIYSILWRASICNDIVFNDLNLIKEEEEELRQFLLKFSYQKEADLFNGLDELVSLPSHSHIIFRSERLSKTPHAGLYCKTVDRHFHHLGLVEFALFYYTDNTKLPRKLKLLDNNNIEDEVKVGLFTPKQWQAFNYSLVKALL